MIYKNQPLVVKFTDENGEDMSILTLHIDYWAPGNDDGDTPTGTITDGNITKSVDGNASIIQFTFAENVLNVSSKNLPWRFHVVDDTSNVPWDTQQFNVKERAT